MIKAEFNGVTQENVMRDFTSEELEEWHLIEQQASLKAQAEAELTIKKAAAEAKLTALGLNSDDLKALGLS
jgi:hypothetical protein